VRDAPATGCYGHPVRHQHAGHERLGSVATVVGLTKKKQLKKLKEKFGLTDEALHQLVQFLFLRLT